MIDSDLKPWLIEVNSSPSFKTESGLDARIKRKLVNDTLILLNLSYKRKMRHIQSQKNEMKKRMLTGKKVRLTAEEKEEKIRQKQMERDEFEKNNLHGYKLIYPSENEE